MLLSTHLLPDSLYLQIMGPGLTSGNPIVTGSLVLLGFPSVDWQSFLFSF